MITEESKREVKRRQREQMQLAEDRIRELTAQLATKVYSQHSKSYKHQRRYDAATRCTCTDEELHAETEQSLANMREHLRVWSAPFDWELPVVFTKKEKR